jgi:hypothetical protein
VGWPCLGFEQAGACWLRNQQAANKPCHRYVCHALKLVIQWLIGLNSEDDKVSLDELQEKLEEFEDFIMSTDVVAMQSES